MSIPVENADGWLLLAHHPYTDRCEEVSPEMLRAAGWVPVAERDRLLDALRQALRLAPHREACRLNNGLGSCNCWHSDARATLRATEALSEPTKEASDG